MQNISDLLQLHIEPKSKKESTIKTERQYILSLFTEEINKERDGVKYKKVPPRLVGIKLSILKSNSELYQFLSECKDYKSRNGSFGKRFWGGFKNRT